MRTAIMGSMFKALRGSLLPTTLAGTPGTGGAGGMASATYFGVLTVIIDGIEGAKSAESTGQVVTGPTGKIAWTWVAPTLPLGTHTVTYNLYTGTVSGTYLNKSTGLTGTAYEQDAYTAGSAVVPPSTTTQAAVATTIKGEGGSYQGGSSAGPVSYVADVETAFNGTYKNIKRRINNLSEIKRAMRKYAYGNASFAASSIIGFIGRPGQ